MRITLALALFFAASTKCAEPTRILTANFAGGCDSFTISVTGDGLNQPNPVVSYNILLTPRSGEPIGIVDSFPVTPEKDGTFRKTIRQDWKKFEYALSVDYTLSGNVILASNLSPLHALTIEFAPKKLKCGRRR